MKKLLGITLTILFGAGCSACHDGSNWYLGHAGGYQYTECERGCCQKDDPSKCKCTAKCSCHKTHACPDVHHAKSKFNSAQEEK